MVAGVTRDTKPKHDDPLSFPFFFAGFSIGATLGMAAAHAGTDRRVVTLVGDGSSQVRSEREEGREGGSGRALFYVSFLHPPLTHPPF